MQAFAIAGSARLSQLATSCNTRIFSLRPMADDGATIEHSLQEQVRKPPQILRRSAYPKRLANTAGELAFTRSLRLLN